jgi:hypothetical protein
VSEPNILTDDGDYFVVQCGFCGARLPEPAAVMADWIPYYFVGQTEISRPTCSDCATQHLVLGDDGEWELSPPADQPIIVN